MKMTLRALVLVLSAICISLPAFAEIYAVHSDHLGTPIRLTDSDKRIVWSATNRGYGEGIYNSDPDGDGRKVDMPLRYPGQYYDKESGLHYNYFRYYDPTVGRYITSDPIGLAGGINTYGYAGGNAVNNIDPLGLFYGGAYPNPAMYSLYGVDGATGYVNDLNMSGALGGLMGFGGVAGFACYGSPACLALMGYGLNAADNAGLIDAPMCSVAKGLPVSKNLPKNIHPGQQGKHIPGHNNFTPGRSPLAEGVNPQQLLDGVQSGAHPIIRMTPRGQPVVDFGKTIGQFDGKGTQFGIIHHGKNGAHIVPANPVQF